VPCLILVAGLLSGVQGCANLKKQTGTGDHAAAPAKSAAPAAVASADPLMNNASVRDLNGFLTGRVMDIDVNRLSDAYVRIDGAQQPIEVEAKGGYFAVEKLKPGKQYKLTARTKQGDRLVAGVSFVTVPDTYVLIKMSQRFATASTPAPPDPPSLPEGKKEKEKEKAAERPAPAGGAGWEPGMRTQPGGGIGIGAPEPLRPGDVPPQSPGWKPNIVQGEAAPQKDIPINVPGSGGPPQPWDRRPEPPPPPAIKGPASSPDLTAEPSCSLLGSRLLDLRLPDLSGGTWQWSKDRRGKVVLIDFWYTTCLPCRDTIPKLCDLQTRYGGSGLEVVGIACEPSGDAKAQAYRVASLCQYLKTNYRQLLAAERTNPVRVQFDPRGFPHMVLVDETGAIIWRHTGALSPADQAVLERAIGTQLGLR
jgi:thiol-disulfide isomerase/thioredoxin